VPVRDNRIHPDDGYLRQMTYLAFLLLFVAVIALSRFVELPQDYENDEEERWWWDIK
jgi:hypothetical protein